MIQVNAPVFLIGFMGAGKTTIGEPLAEALNYSFLDLDIEIEKVAKMGIPDIFQQKGEPEFRELESATLRKVTSNKLVIATGGGVIQSPGNIEWMNNWGNSVYLKASFETVYDRIHGDSHRPLTSLSYSNLKKRFEERATLYENADIIINTEGRSVEEVCLSIAEQLAKKHKT